MSTKLPTSLSELHLKPSELNSPLWKRIEAAIRGELEAMRKQNDDTGMRIDQTTILRGRIDLAKRILALSEEVGPESQESEAIGHESHSAGLLAGIPMEHEES